MSEIVEYLFDIIKPEKPSQEMRRLLEKVTQATIDARWRGAGRSVEEIAQKALEPFFNKYPRAKVTCQFTFVEHAPVFESIATKNGVPNAECL